MVWPSELVAFWIDNMMSPSILVVVDWVCLRVLIPRHRVQSGQRSANRGCEGTDEWGEGFEEVDGHVRPFLVRSGGGDKKWK